MSGFDTTQWSLVLASAGQSKDSAAALDRLCRAYRAPVLGYLRAQGHGIDAAEDLTQAFFAHLLGHRLHELADPARGSFRAFLLSSLRHFVVSEQRRESARKRGGEVLHVPLDGIREPVADDSPELAFEREWAHTVIARALHELRVEARQADRLELFAVLSPFLFQPPAAEDYTRLGERLGMASNTVAVAVHRLRQRLRKRVEEQIQRTIGDAAQVSAEMAVLQRWMKRPPRSPSSV